MVLATINDYHRLIFTAHITTAAYDRLRHDTNDQHTNICGTVWVDAASVSVYDRRLHGSYYRCELPGYE